MIYPDEEKITDSYNLGGQLEKVHGYKSYGYDYVSKIGYDKFEQRTYLKYCDGPSILADKNIPISLYWYKKENNSYDEIAYIFHRTNMLLLKI